MKAPIHAAMRAVAMTLAMLASACPSAGARETGGVAVERRDANAGGALESRQILVTFIDERILRAPSGTPGRYYGGARDYQSSTWARRLSARIAADHGLSLVKEWPMLVLGVHCVVYEVPDAARLDDVLDGLRKDRRIDSAQRMNHFRVMHADPYRPLQKSLTLLDVEAAHRWSMGKGTTIAVIDSGVDRRHPDLMGQLAQDFDFTDSPAAEFDTDVHGTAVAGVIVAGGHNELGIIGVAPAAKVLPMKACWAVRAGAAEAVCNTFTLAQALETAIREGVDVLNLSLSGPADALLEALLQKAVERDVIVVLAQPATGGEEALAANMAQVFRVVATGEEGQVRNDYAVRAPGVDVLTTFPGARYDFISGSSFAAAHVSGVVALLRALAPNLPATRIAETLRGSSPGGTAVTVNACQAVARLRGGGDCAPPRAALVSRSPLP